MRRLCVACALAIGTAGMAWAETDDAPIAQSSAEAAPAPSASAAQARKSPAARFRRLASRGLIAGIVLFAFGGAAAGVVANQRRRREGKGSNQT